MSAQMFAKFGDSMSNRSRDIREADFVTNEQTNKTYGIRHKRLLGVSPKKATQKGISVQPGHSPQKTHITPIPVDRGGRT